MKQSRISDALVSLIRSKKTERVVDFILVPLLLVSSMWLPPTSLGARLFHTDYPIVTPKEGAVVPGPYGARLDVPAGAVEKRSRMALDALDCSNLASVRLGNPNMFTAAAAGSLTKLNPDSPEALAVQSLPQDLIVYGPIYRLDVRSDAPSSAFLSLPIPYELGMVEKADLYGWDGESWVWLPSQHTSDKMNLQAELEPVPSLLAITERAPGSLRIGHGVSPEAISRIPKDLGVSTFTLTGLRIGGDASLVGQAVSARHGATATGDVAQGAQAFFFLSISNVEDGIVRSDLVDNLIISSEQTRAHIQNILSLVEGGGYDGVEIAYQGVDPSLRPEFGAFIKELAQALHAKSKKLAVVVDPAKRAWESWDTGGYDWSALAQTADSLRVPALLDPSGYAENGEMDALLTWATGMIDRRKIDLLITADSRDLMGDRVDPIRYEDALDLLAQKIETDDPDHMLLPGESTTLRLPNMEQASLNYDAGAQTYWFTCDEGDGATHTIWLENAASVARKLQYVARYALGGVSVRNALDERNDKDVPQVLSTFQENIVPTQAQFAAVWTTDDEAGNVVDRQVVPLDNSRLAWTAPENTGNYLVSAALSDDGGETSFGAASQVGMQVPTPTFTPTPTNTPTPTATPTSTPKPTPTPKPKAKVASVPRGPLPGSGSFGYGIQAHMMGDDTGRILDSVKALGFGWVKQQVEWFRYNPGPGQYDWGALDRIVNEANARGIKVLFSVVKAPQWTRGGGADLSVDGPPQNLQHFADFMGAMAARYKGRVGAYEVWNEQNLHYEWGNETLDPVRYVEMLKLVYGAIKAQDPQAFVISGALTPTGAPPPLAMDDFAYLEKMYQAGLKNYCDGIGVHPSGYNIPPDVPWLGYEDPVASFRGPWNTPHHSWAFQATMLGYRNIMVVYGDAGKRLWPTEFGWASCEGLGAGPAPNYEYAADNTEAEQARFLVTAYQMAKGWGWVGPMFTWNLNFGPVSGKQDEKAAFSLLRENWSQRPAFAALRDMPK